MDIEYLRDPFEHAIIDNILSDEDCNQLWNLANHIPEKSIDFTRGGEQSDNAYMWNNNAGHNATHEIIDGRLHYAVTLASRMFDDYNDEFYTWSCALTETNRNHGNFLYPHNDDPEVLKQVNAFVSSIGEREYLNPQKAVNELKEKLSRVGLSFDCQIEGDKGSKTVDVKQFGGRFGKDTDGSDINDDGISHKKEGGLKIEVSHELLQTGTSKVYAKLV